MVVSLSLVKVRVVGLGCGLCFPFGDIGGSAVQYSTVQYEVAQYSAVQYSAVHYSSTNQPPISLSGIV